MARLLCTTSQLACHRLCHSLGLNWAHWAHAGLRDPSFPSLFLGIQMSMRQAGCLLFSCSPTRDGFLPLPQTSSTIISTVFLNKIFFFFFWFEFFLQITTHRRLCLNLIHHDAILCKHLIGFRSSYLKLASHRNHTSHFGVK